MHTSDPQLPNPMHSAALSLTSSGIGFFAGLNPTTVGMVCSMMCASCAVITCLITIRRYVRETEQDK